MANSEKASVTLEALLISSLAQIGALAKLLIEKSAAVIASWECPKTPETWPPGSRFVSITCLQENFC